MGILIKHLYKKLFQIFFLFLFGAFVLYSLIDFSTKGPEMSAIGLGIDDLMITYGLHFLKRLDILLPFAAMLASIKTTTQLNTSNELVALLSSGVSIKRLIRPILIFGLLGTLFLYFNNEFGKPKALRKLQIFEDTYLQKPEAGERSREVFSFFLEDESQLIFKSYDFAERQFTDVFWVRSLDEIYRAETLFPHAAEPIGTYVEVLRRDGNNLILEKTFDTYIFRQMKIDEENLSHLIMDSNTRPLSTLYKQLPSTSKPLSDQGAEILSAFYQKLFNPWLSFFWAFLPILFCVRFSRHLPTFRIYTLSIFAFIAFYTMMDACYILGESSLYNPLVVIGTPYLFLAILTLFFYLRIDR